MTPKEWSCDHVGDGYIMGAKGQKCSLKFREQQAKLFPAYADKILGIGEKWDGKKVWDCATFTREAWRQAGIEIPAGATRQWRADVWEKKGTIDTLPKGEVCSVFREGNGKKQHTGLYTGDGFVNHAQGTNTGVIRQQIDKYPWTDWAVPKTQNTAKKEVVNVEVLYQAQANGTAGSGTVNMRSSASKTSDIVKVVPKGGIVDVFEEDGDWCLVQYAGKSGYMMKKYLDGKKQDGSLYSYERLDDHEERIQAAEKKLARIEEYLRGVGYVGLDC